MIDILLKPVRLIFGFKFLTQKQNECTVSVEDIYTPLSVAKEEIQRRWNDENLKKKVNEFLSGEFPEFIKDIPQAVLCRDVISPTKEFLYFQELSKQIGLQPAFVEYSDSKFVARNLNKYYLGKLCFFNGIGKKGGDKIENIKVVNFNEMEGKKIKEIKTTWNQDFIQFHHELLGKIIPDFNFNDISDFSEWFNKHRKMSEYYYLHYLALFIVHGVLFENFIVKNGERDFTESKVIPSFLKLQEIFGVKPLIVPISSLHDECELFWWYYPYSAKKIVEDYK